MNQQDVLIKVAKYLSGNHKVVTLNKVSSETGLDSAAVEEALETMSEKGLASKRTIDDFDESCYQANENTDLFCQKIAEKAPKASPLPESRKENKPTSKASKGTSEDLIESFLREHGADDGLLERYSKLLSERNHFKKRSSVWEKHIGQMVANVTKDLKS